MHLCTFVSQLCAFYRIHIYIEPHRSLLEENSLSSSLSVVSEQSIISIDEFCFFKFALLQINISH